MHTKGWGSILILNIFLSRSQALVLVHVSPICEAAKRIQKLPSHLTQPSCQAPEQRAAFRHLWTLCVCDAFLGRGQGRIQPVLQLNWERFSEESTRNISKHPTAAPTPPLSSGLHNLQKVRTQTEMEMKRGPRYRVKQKCKLEGKLEKHG